MQSSRTRTLQLIVIELFLINNCEVIFAKQDTKEQDSRNFVFFGTQSLSNGSCQVGHTIRKNKRQQLQRANSNFESPGQRSDQRARSLNSDEGQKILEQIENLKKLALAISKHISRKQEILSSKNQSPNSHFMKDIPMSTACSSGKNELIRTHHLQKAQMTQQYFRVSNSLKNPKTANLIAHIMKHPLELIVGLQLLYELKLTLLADYKRRFLPDSVSSIKCSEIKNQIIKSENQLKNSIRSLFDYFDANKELLIIEKKEKIVNKVDEVDEWATAELIELICHHEDQFREQTTVYSGQIDQIKEDLIKLIEVFDIYGTNSLKSPRKLSKKMMLKQVDLDMNIEAGLGGIEELIYNLYLVKLGLQKSQQQILQFPQTEIPSQRIDFLDKTCFDAGKVHQNDQELYRLIKN